MKKPAKKSAKTKPAAKAAAKKSPAKKPAPKAKTVDGGRRQGAEPAKSTVGTYQPRPIQGIGWAPFRYPLS
jgi:hypothetical protein